MTRMFLSSLATLAVLAMAAGGAVPAEAAKKRNKAAAATSTAKEVNTEGITLTQEKVERARRSGATRRRAR